MTRVQEAIVIYRVLREDYVRALPWWQKLRVVVWGLTGTEHAALSDRAVDLALGPAAKKAAEWRQ